MKKTKKIVFPALVREEAKNLKKYATESEISKLDIESFSPKYGHSCIYGMLTGDCHTLRATELIEQCAKRVYKTPEEYIPGKDYLANKLNGSPKKAYRSKYWSPIEVYIYPNKNLDGAKKLIKYLKGEIRTL